MAAASSRLEGVLYVDDPGGAVARENTYHVEADRREIRLSFGEVPFGQGADGSLLAGGDGLEGISEPDSAPHLDFDEDERVGSNVQTPTVHFRALLTEGAQKVGSFELLKFR